MQIEGIHKSDRHRKLWHRSDAEGLCGSKLFLMKIKKILIKYEAFDFCLNGFDFQVIFFDGTCNFLEHNGRLSNDVDARSFERSA